MLGLFNFFFFKSESFRVHIRTELLREGYTHRGTKKFPGEDGSPSIYSYFLALDRITSTFRSELFKPILN